MEKSALASAEPGETESEEPHTRELRLALEAQSRYMSFLSHDLRGSLNGLVLMVEVLKREVEGKGGKMEDVLADLAMMKRALVDTVGMMERHVLADRLRRGKAVINRQPLKLAELVQEAIARALHTARYKPTLEVDVPADAVINADRDLLRLALQEMVDNLAKHCGQCHGRLHAQKSDERWLIEVSDDGPGMPPDRLEQWLDPDKRGQLKERGLGLTLAQLIARAMGGRLEATSQEGRGVTLRMWIADGGNEQSGGG